MNCLLIPGYCSIRLMDISHKIKFGIFFVCLLFVSLQLVCIFVLKYNGNDIHI